MRERERERDGSDVTIVTLKLAMSLPFLLPKNSHNCDEFTLSLAKNSPLSFLPSHVPSCRAKIGDELTLSLAKNSHNCDEFTLFLASLLLLWPIVAQCSCSMKHWKKSIKLIPKTIGNRKRDCARGCASVKKLKKINCWAHHHQAKQIWVLMICAQQLIYLQFFNTRASSRIISFSISNSFWY